MNEVIPSVDVSGERLTLGKSSKRNQDDHTARYEFASLDVEGKNILDIACGTGYGSKMLAESGAKKVYGVDIDLSSIEYARKNFTTVNTEYICSAAGELDFPKNFFDLIVSFETIEHLEYNERMAYLTHLREMLKEDGVIILSTPNKLITSPWSKKPLNPFHILEYYRTDLEKELGENRLKITGWYGQRFVNIFFTKRVIYLVIRVIEKIIKKSLGIYEIANGPTVRELNKKIEPRYFVVKICK